VTSRLGTGKSVTFFTVYVHLPEILLKIDMSWNGEEQRRKKTVRVSISQFQFERLAKREGGGGSDHSELELKFLLVESEAWEFSH
jgi:hypothetical protein